MDDNMLRLESVEFEDWGASRIDGKFDVDQRTLLYDGNPGALREILRALRRGLGIVEETRDGVYPRLESVEFEGWSASRISGKLDVGPRTLLYGDDSDALCEIVDALRRGLGLVEEALERRLSAVGKRRVRELGRESDWRQVRRRPANAPLRRCSGRALRNCRRASSRARNRRRSVERRLSAIGKRRVRGAERESD